MMDLMKTQWYDENLLVWSKSYLWKVKTLLKNYKFDENWLIWWKLVAVTKIYKDSLLWWKSIGDKIMIHWLHWWKYKTVVKIKYDEGSKLGWKFTPLIELIDVMKVYQCD